MSTERIISKDEFLKLVEKITPKFPVLKRLKEQGYEYENWTQNIKNLVDEELNIERRVVIIQTIP